jgi:ABC-type antimicrobial peptide transport system permease subunit
VFHTIPELLSDELGRDRVTARIATLFGLMALILASIGLYGVLSYGVSRRVGEIGVRLALGARPIGIVRLIVRDALRVVGLGVVVGTCGALLASSLLGSMLYGMTARDPLTFAGALLVLVIVAAFAAAIPAWRAAGTDPLVALRGD